MTPIGALLILALLSASSWTFVSLIHRLRRTHASVRWWVTFAALVVIGLLAGVWCAFYFEYHWGPRYRVASFPVPVVFFHLEDGDWVDFPVPRAQAWAT